MGEYGGSVDHLSRLNLNTRIGEAEHNNNPKYSAFYYVTGTDGVRLVH